MNTQRWQQIEEIFQSALDLAPAERKDFIAEQCGENFELKREVEKLLADYASAESFIESPVWTKNSLLGSSAMGDFGNSLDEQLKEQPVDPMLGRQIGAYRLEKEIGRGGMGAVYQAERADGSFRQRVAIKLIKRGMDTDFILRRFRQERQILAQLSHPFIAQLLDGGTTADDLPYFVMEFIEGEPLYRYCDRKKLTINERLKLFRQICQALDFAHQNQIIHRDIKPPNILVSARGTPKLLDFGIAKVLNPEFGIDTIDPTLTAMRLMTPEYASPEQVCGSPVTPASDIYALGVLLYELLTGHRPYRFKNRAAHEIARVICEEEPDRPSTGITRRDNLLPTGASEATTLVDLCRFRGAERIEDLQRELAGDIERIILKCLRKEQTERYQTAAELEQDIARYLEGKPVAAESFSAVAAVAAAQPPTQTDALAKSLAVLPLKVLSRSPDADTGEEFLSVGLADALITRLSGVQRLVVRPTSSVLRFGADGGDAFAAGKELGVDFVVDGNIRRVGKRIRVTAQLLNVKNNSTFWSESFDEQFTDFLALEDSISERVVKSLIPQLTGEEEKQLSKRGTNSPDAYQAYLRGRFYWNLFTPDTFPKALEWFEKAIALDEKYALAWVGMADFYNWATIFGIYSPPEGYRKTRAAAVRALEIDNQLSEAHAVLGFLTTFADFDWTRGEYLLKHALELNPHNALAHEWYSALLAGTGRDREAKREILRAHELDPLSLREKTLTAWHLYQLRLFPEALAVAEEIIEMNPLFYQGFFQRGNVLNEMGRSAEAVADLRKAVGIAPEAGYLYYKLCFALVGVGQRDEARQVLRDFEKLPKSAAASAYHLAMCYAALDERETTFEWFEKAVENRDMWLVWLATDPKLDKLRDDERFNELLRKTNRPHLVRQIRKIPKASQAAAKVFAVLPFKFNSLATGGGDADDKFLGVGLTDALISRLSKTASLIVRPTSSVLQFNETSDAFAAGRELAAAFVLDGNVRRVGERIRVSVQLLNINQTATAWAETFDEKFTDILEVEDSIAERVAESLLPHLTGEEHRRISKRGTDSPAAYEAYLRGRFHWNQFTPESLAKAIESFQTAIRLDENYALAWVGIADFYTWANIYGLIPSAPALDEAERAARRAIEIDERLGEGYASLGSIIHHRMRWKEAKKLKQQAIKLNPNYSHAHEWWAAQLIGLGETDEGVKEMRLAESLDPLSLRTKTLTAWTLYQAHRFDDALETARQISELDKNYPQGYSQAGFALWAMGRHEEALANFQKFDEMIPGFALAKYQLCFGLAAVNRHAEALAVLKEIKTLAESGYVKPFFLAMAHVAVGERDAAFEYFEQSFNEQEPWLLWFGTDPMLESLHDDARYANLLERMNNPLAEKFKRRREVADQPKTFAVLPFKLLQFDTGDDTEDRFLSIGLTDALITRLSKMRQVVVRPTSAVMRFGDTADAFQAGRELAADFVLAGNIRRAGNRVRVSAQLLGVADQSTAWAETFDEKFTDVLELEDSIAERVAKSLLPQLTGEERKQLQKRETNLPDAYEAYLKGRFYWSLMTEEGFSKAIGFYERAVALDPNYALAYAAIAEYYSFLAIHCIIPFAEAGRRAKDAAERAAAIDPALAEAQAALGIAAINHDFDWDAAEKYFRRALEISPNSILAHSWYQSLLLQSGQIEEASAILNRLLELNPDALVSLHYLAWAHFHARRFDESVQIHRRMLGDEPNYAWGHFTFSWLLRCAGEHAEAVAEAQKGVELAAGNPMYLTALAAALAENGQRDEAVKTLDAINEMAAARYVSPYMLAIVYCSLGDGERAFERLETALAERDVWIVWLYVDPQFDRLRDDARFDDLLRRMNHPLAPHEKVTEIKKPINEPPIERREKSIAVLPLKLLGATGGENTGEDNFLSVGLADALITRLSNVRRFVVRPTSSVLRFGTESSDSFDAGRKLGVDYVVDGSIRRVGERIRVSLQLLNIKENSTRWAEKFDEHFTDVLEIEDSISERVAESLIPRLMDAERERLKKRGTNDPQAYEAYLRGRFYWSLQSEESFAKAVTFFERAVALDPNYALAYAAIAEYYIFLGIHCVVPFTEKAQKAKDLVEKAVGLDPSLAAARAMLGFIEVCYNRNWAAAEKHLRHALRLNPNSVTAHNWLSTVLLQTGRFEEAVGETDRVIELDPDSIVSLHIKAWTLYHSRRFAESIEFHQKTLKNEPNYAWGLQTYSWVLRRVGRFAEAVAQAERSVQLTGENPFYLPHLAAAYAEAGMRDRAEGVLTRLAEISKTRFVSEYMLALAYCALGDKDRAFENLEKSLAARDGWLNWLAIDPQFDVLRADERFEDLLRRASSPSAKPKAKKEVKSGADGEKSIAVLPLKLLGATGGEDTGEDNFLSVGLADALITRLSNVRRFVVRPTSSVLPYGKKAFDSFAAGRELGVDYVVEGSIRRSGTRIRITAQLLSVRENATRWAQTYDENFVDVLTLEDSISEQIAKSLLPHLSGEEKRQIKKRGTDNPEAFEAYLRGRHYWNTFTEEGFAKSLIYYNQAISMAPDYALAYAGIADYHNWLGIYAVLPFAETSAAAKEAAQRAVKLDENLAEAHSALGFAVHSHDFDWQTAETHHRRALELNPNYAVGRVWYCHFLTVAGRFDEALREVEEARRLDPLTPIIQHTFSWAHFYARRFDRSIKAARSLIADEPTYGMGYVFLCLSLLQAGKHGDAIEAGKRCVALLGRTPYTLVWLASAHAARGETAEAKRLLAEIEELSARRYASPYLLAMVYCNLQETERSLELLEKARQIRDARLLWLGVDPQFDALRGEARFETVLRQTNNPLVSNR